MVGCSCFCLPSIYRVVRVSSAMRALPRVFWKKRPKRAQRGCKLMKIREMPQSQRENGRNEEGQRGTPRGNSDGYQNTGLAGKAIRKNMKTKARRSRQGSQKAARRLCSGSIRVAGRTEET